MWIFGQNDKFSYTYSDIILGKEHTDHHGCQFRSWRTGSHKSRSSNVRRQSQFYAKKTKTFVNILANLAVEELPIICITFIKITFLRCIVSLTVLLLFTITILIFHKNRISPYIFDIVKLVIQRFCCIRYRWKYTREIFLYEQHPAENVQTHRSDTWVKFYFKTFVTFANSIQTGDEVIVANNGKAQEGVNCN